MTSVTVGIIGLGVMIVLMFAGMPIGFAMGLVGFLGFAYLNGFDAALALAGMVPYRTLSDYGFSVIPLFMLMGAFSFAAGISSDLYQCRPEDDGSGSGGLAMASIVAMFAFGAICGSRYGNGSYHGGGSIAGDEKSRISSWFCYRHDSGRRDPGDYDTAQLNFHYLRYCR
jgi:hypothetical protein